MALMKVMPFPSLFRTKLCTLNNDLKMLDWMASVTDPSLLKKVDKMASASRERE